MSDILIQSSRMKECEEINLGKNESKVIYQDFDTKITEDFLMAGQTARINWSHIKLMVESDRTN